MDRSRYKQPVAQIRDPIHGSIDVTTAEVRLIDAPFYQRLRNVKQLGFTDLAFPGGTHTRYAHSIGAMHVATRIFDGIAARLDLTDEDRRRFRQTLRIAVLFHDVGHAPYSHASESIMPARADMKLPAWTVAAGQGDRQADHEDYTLKIILDTDIARIVRDEFGGMGIDPKDLAGLVSGRPAPGGEKTFVSRGIDWAPMLRQIVSSELDADRMDYLQRDSFYTGVNYGHFDLDWLASNLSFHVKDDAAFLALGKRAIFAFEDFLLSRYHMFLSVYYHYTPICFDNMLKHYYREATGEYAIPADVEEYLHHDDVTLMSRLRESKNRWAQAIVSRRPWRMIAEKTELDEGYDLDDLVTALKEAGIEAFRAESKGVLSKYFRKLDSPTLYVHDPSSERWTPVENYTQLYGRYAETMRLMRVYVDPEKGEAAARITKSMALA